MLPAPLVPITLAFLLGILLGTFVPGILLVLVLLGMTGAGVGLLTRDRARTASIALVTLWICLGMLRVELWQHHPDQQLQSILPAEPQPVRLHGVVYEDPTQPFDPDDEPSQRCLIILQHVQGAQGWVPIRGRVQAILHRHAVELAYGDEILVEGEWMRVPPPGNPGQYNWRAALARQRIHGLLRVHAFDGVVVLRKGAGHPWLAALFRLRQRWARLIQQTFQEPNAGLLQSLLLGQRVTLNKQLTDAFRETGTIHLLVISGFNVGLIAMLLEGVLRFSGVPWRIRLFLSALSVGGYSILTGFQPPVVRATLMAWVVLGALAMDRVVSWFNVLAAAALLMLWVSPMQLCDPSCQLSFGAVLSLLVFTPRWQRWLEPRLSWLRPRWLRRYVAVSVSATSAIWVGLAPILAWYFYLVSPVSMLANLLLAPLVSGLVTVGSGVLLVATVCEPVMRWSRDVLSLFVSGVIRSVSLCHVIPGGHWVVGQPSWLEMSGYYSVLVISVLRSASRWSVGRVLMCWSCGVVIWIWSHVAHHAFEQQWLRVDVLDVGHGDSIVVRTPRGRILLIDSGTREAGQFRVLPWFRYHGISRLDGLFLTHPDEDHIGGAPLLLEELQVARLLTNGVQDDTMSARAISRLVAARGIPDIVVALGLRLEGEPEIRIEVLHPPRGLVPGAAPDSNDNSVVLKLTKGSVSILLCGDLEEMGVPWVLQHAASLRATVLQVPHHGSRLGEVGKRFFDAVHPEVAVLSVGRVHHLPAQETLDAVARTGARLYSTRDDGAISLRTNGTQLEVRTFR